MGIKDKLLGVVAPEVALPLKAAQAAKGAGAAEERKEAPKEEAEEPAGEEKPSLFQRLKEKAKTPAGSEEAERLKAFKETGGKVGKKIIMILTFISTFVLIIFGSGFMALIPFIILILMAIFWFKGYTRWLIVIPVIAMLIFFFFWSQSSTGKILSAQAGKTMPFNYEATRAVAGPLNIMKQVLTGSYDPSEMWSSKTYEDQYVQYSDIGVKIEDVKPLRDTFIKGNDLVVVGKLSAKSLPDDNQGSNIDVSIKWTEDGLGGWNVCEPSRIEQAQAYYTRFQCTCSAGSCLTEAKDIETHTAEVTVDYAFTERAGKQVYVASYEDINRIYMQGQEPMSYYQISSAEVASWQTQGPVGLGIGILGGENLIATTSPKNPSRNYLGVSIVNNGIGDIKTIDAVDVTLPCEDIIIDYMLKESDFNNFSTSNLGGLKLCKFSLSPGVRNGLASENKPLGPAETKTVFLPFRVTENFLKGGAVSSFFVKTDLRFVYREKNNVALTVKVP